MTSATGTHDITVAGDTLTVDAPAPTPGCLGPARTDSGTLTITWTGINRGDGNTTSGTTTGGGTLTTTVTWTVVDDEGDIVVEPSDGSYSSNCPSTPKRVRQSSPS
ncbi:hypothetical protein [Nonomuraea sp. NPDC049784]|uniref:hypothetical protein n=1 Tax=Nonomuraea sp. NPDC049784 TaxID=3154361 RepID=UPI0033C572F5